MNIFVLHQYPRKCAEMHCDKHIVKMPVEMAQMLSTAHHTHDSEYKHEVYKPIQGKHPCPRWVSESSENYDWTFDLFYWLCKEYSKRYGRDYKSFELSEYLKNNPCPEGEMTERPLCMPDRYKTDDPVESYRNYYLGDKLEIAEWNFSEVPDFVKEAK